MPVKLYSSHSTSCVYEFHAMMTFLNDTNSPKLFSLLEKLSFISSFENSITKSHHSKNFLPANEPSQSPRAFGSCRPTYVSSESTEATGPQYLIRPTTTRPDLAMTFASCPGFKHFGDFGRNGSDCFDGW